MSDDEQVDVDEDEDDGTVQSTVLQWHEWIMLRLKVLMPTIHDSVLIEFVRDCPSDLEAFLQRENDALCSTVLFIAPILREIRASTPLGNIYGPVANEPADETKVLPGRKAKAWQQKPSKKKKKSDQKTSKKAISSPKRIHRPNVVVVPKAETTINVELAAELEQEIRAAGGDLNDGDAGKTNVQLKLSVNAWPDTNEFVYIVVRQPAFSASAIPHLDANITDTHGFDQRFHVGITRTGDSCRMADRIVRSILETATDNFSHQMIDILAFLTMNLKELPRKSGDNLYDFVLCTVIEAVTTKVTKRRSNVPTGRDTELSDPQAANHADSMNQLLAPEIHRYCHRLQLQQATFEADDVGDRLCMMKCQLALFDIDFLLDPTLTVTHVGDRLKWATQQLDLMVNMSASDGALQKWLTNAIAYLCEFVGRVVANRLARKAEVLTTGGPVPVTEKEENGARFVTWMAQNMVSDAIDLQASLSSAISNGPATTEIDRLDAATRLLIPLEEEMERVLQLMGRLDDERRDMARQRTAIDQAWHSVRAIGRSIEALSLEGAIEAGNTEALRDLCRQVGDDADRLQQQIEQLQ